MRKVNLIPMAGEGKRFVDKGITTPKPLIEISGKPFISFVNSPIVLSFFLVYTFPIFFVRLAILNLLLAEAVSGS